VLLVDIGLSVFELHLADEQSIGASVPLNANTDPLTPDQQAIITRLTIIYPWANRSLIEWLVRHNIAEASIANILAMLDPAHQADYYDLVQSLTTGDPDDCLQIAQLLRAGFTKDQIREIFAKFTAAQRAALTARIAAALKSGKDAYGLTTADLN